MPGLGPGVEDAGMKGIRWPPGGGPISGPMLWGSLDTASFLTLDGEGDEIIDKFEVDG